MRSERSPNGTQEQRLSDRPSTGNGVIDDQNNDRANDRNNHAVDIKAGNSFSAEKGEEPAAY